LIRYGDEGWSVENISGPIAGKWLQWPY
jgi:hypothetical protein